MKIVWSSFAINQIRNLRKHHSYKIVSDLRLRTKALKEFPLLGQKEDLLEFRVEGFRYLVESNYEIIYWIDNDVVRIYSLFDTRQNPEKLKNLD
jgi:toxin ParE1/3/4